MAQAFSSSLLRPIPQPADSVLQPGGQLDHYCIEHCVAHSGMASVYRATDLRNGRQVALKVPRPGTEAPVFLERLQREEKLCLRLDHPSIIKVFRHENGSHPYMVMEWVEGKSLRQLLDEQHKLPTKRAVTIAMQICDALEHMHSRGVVHHDMKPENIMVCAGDNIRIIDFGIASSSALRKLRFINSAPASGTPDYISPEQVQGKRGDERSDIYAAGTMLYEMLTGQVPFPGSSPLVVMNARLCGTPMPPSRLDASISPRLEQIICRALEKDPRRRYATAYEFACDLEQREETGAKLRQWKSPLSPVPAAKLSYAVLAMLPVLIFVLLIYFARHS